MPNNNIVDADERYPRRAPTMDRNHDQRERFDKWMALAAIVQGIPLFVWAAPFVLIGGFILMALWYNRTGSALQDFTAGVLLWGSRVLIAGGGVLVLIGGWKCYKLFHQSLLDASARRVASAGATKAIAGARNAELKNELLQADIALRQQIPNVILGLTQMGVAFKYDAKGNLEVLGQAGQTMVSQYGGAAQLGAGAQAAIAGPGVLPPAVRYEDVKAQIPEGHALLGVGSGGAVETCDFGQLMTMWICGGSSTGKSNTVGIKIEEAIENGRNLGILCIDYHAKKPDSLYNKIRTYEDRFLMPVAYTEEQALVVLQRFLAEFMRRREVGSGTRDILLVVDEVPAVLESEDEEIVRLLKKIARICGRESRGFGMFGWFISQNAVGLAWLRNVVLTVIAHKMNMLNEAELACNQHKDIARDMENWPRGRVIVYGLSLQGFKVLQMPLKTVQSYLVRSENKSAVAADDEALDVEDDVAQDDPGQEQEQQKDTSAPPPALTGDMRRVFDACEQLHALGNRVSSRAVEGITKIDKDRAIGFMNRLADMGYLPYWERRSKAV